MRSSMSSLWWRDSNQTASGNPGAVQFPVPAVGAPIIPCPLWYTYMCALIWDRVAGKPDRALKTLDVIERVASGTWAAPWRRIRRARADNPSWSVLDALDGSHPMVAVVAVVETRR
jgi:hypothetical protein